MSHPAHPPELDLASARLADARLRLKYVLSARAGSAQAAMARLRPWRMKMVLVGMMMSILSFLLSMLISLLE
ncbi:MAG: hypothetical protein KKC85_16890 [Gammaproteobacteria bacterium]|nr:hypothetical protein [Gammaproteobacteria bacterium]